MGTWGVGPFDNDDAMDLIGDLEESSDASAVLASTVADWLSGDPFAATPQLREVARRTLQRAPHETDNELYALWVEAGEQDTYRSALAPYQDALSR